MKHAIYKSYGKKGEDIVNMNYAAVDAGGNAVERVEVPAQWASIEVREAAHEIDSHVPAFVREVCEPIDALKGDSLPVSAFNGREDGTWDNGTAAYEKRGIAVNVPEWQIENCIQCNQCAYVCPTPPYVRSSPPRSRPQLRASSGSRDWARPRPTSSAFRYRRSTVRAATTASTYAPPSRRLWS